MKKKMTTHDRRFEAIKKLDGEFNGWWIYKYAMGDFAARKAKSELLGYSKPNKRCRKKNPINDDKILR